VVNYFHAKRLHSYVFLFGSNYINGDKKLKRSFTMRPTTRFLNDNLCKQIISETIKNELVKLMENEARRYGQDRLPEI
jgi:hypothetical protein